MAEPLARRLAAEGIGSFFLFACVIGSGIMAANLAGGNDAIALLGNTVATAAMLFVLITLFGPVSRAHLNPAVSLVAALRGELRWGEATAYAGAQLACGVLGAWTAHLMFDLPTLQLSVKARHGVGQWVGEGVATFGLVLTILGTVCHRPHRVPATVALYIAAAYWFTSSTSFANPAITLVRSLSDTFAGIAPADVPAFVAAQLAGGGRGGFRGEGVVSRGGDGRRGDPFPLLNGKGWNQQGLPPIPSTMTAPFAWIRPEPHGIHVVPADCWIDPSIAVPNALVTHGHADHARGGHGRTVATRRNAGDHGTALPDARGALPARLRRDAAAAGRGRCEVRARGARARLGADRARARGRAGGGDRRLQAPARPDLPAVRGRAVRRVRDRGHVRPAGVLSSADRARDRQAARGARAHPGALRAGRRLCAWARRSD